MNMIRCVASTTLAVLVCITGCDKENDSTAGDGTSSAPNRTDNTRAPDNTGRNEVDATGTTKTPLDQSESAAHIKITADIRRTIMDDKSMSTNAQNCKIITDESGRVTLRGVVNSQAEKDSIDAKARAVAGETNVDNQLEVKVND